VQLCDSGKRRLAAQNARNARGEYSAETSEFWSNAIALQRSLDNLVKGGIMFSGKRK
jgi:hypothetical protein